MEQDGEEEGEKHQQSLIEHKVSRIYLKNKTLEC